MHSFPNNGGLPKKQWLQDVAPATRGPHKSERAEVQRGWAHCPQVTHTRGGRAEVQVHSRQDFNIYQLSSVPSTKPQALGIYSIGVWATSWGHAQEGRRGLSGTSGKISHQNLRTVALTGWISPPTHPWQDLLIQPWVDSASCRVSEEKWNAMLLLLQSLWRSPHNNQIHGEEPPTATVHVKSGLSRSYQPPQNINLKHPIFLDSWQSYEKRNCTHNNGKCPKWLHWVI